MIGAIAGAAGALCRYLISGWTHRLSRSDFPVGTLTVNLTGSFLLGLVAGTNGLNATTSLAIVGFLGGYTTFSTWMIETIRLGFPVLRSTRAFANLFLALIAGIALAAAGYVLTN
ncbi:MAG: CrcB family protein [Acidimicrobiia bacterium]